MLKWLIPITTAGLATAAMAQAPAPAPAQLSGEIDARDQSDGEGRRYDDYPVELVRGQRILMTAAPAAGSRVVPNLEVFVPGTGAPAGRAVSGDNRIARLGFTAPRSGVYLIRVVAGDAAAGRYTLAIASSPTPPSRAPTGAMARPPAPTPGDGASEGPAGSGGPLARFIICPGHPRCPR